MAQHQATYNVAVALRLKGDLDVASLREAIRFVCHNYRIYRTLYRQTEDGVEARVSGDLEPDLEVVDVEDDAEGDVSPAIRSLSNLARQPFRLDMEAPLRIRIYRISSQCHVLGLIFHHIANDGASINLFWDAVRRAYANTVAGHAPDPVAAEHQYEAYAQRQRSLTTSARLDKALQYWIGQLKDAPATLGLTVDFPAHDGVISENCELIREVGSLEDCIGTLARQEATTRHVIYLAAYYAWLYRETGAVDAVVGVPINDRSRRDDEGVLGCCINMLSIRQQVQANWSFRQLVRATHGVMREGIRNVEMPFLRLVGELDRSNSSSFGFYETTFQYRNFVEEFGPIGDCKVEGTFPPRRYSQFPIMLEVYPLLGVPRVSLTYDTQLFRPETAQGMVERFCAIAEAAVTSPDTAVADLAWIDAEQVQGLISEGANQREYPRNASIHVVFAEQVRLRPEAIALVQGVTEISYAELNRTAEAIASGLVDQGVEPGARIGICMARSAELISAMLGILRAGCCYVPLDPEYPQSRLEFMIQDAELSAIMVDDASAERVPSWAVPLLRTSDLLTAGRTDTHLVPVSASAPAYLMYTSGSTGQPKGTLIPHRGIVRLVCGADYADLSPNQTFLQLSSPSFDAATFEIWAPLLNGGKLVLMPAGTPSIREIGDAIQNHGVTTLWLTAGLFHVIVDEAPEILRPLRQLLAGGDVLSPPHVRKCLDVCPDLQFINGYGPTENTTFSCCFVIPPEISATAAIPIGRPIANSEAYVLDERLRPLPPGVAGELFVGGDGLALGYWRRPDLTAERFVVHPFSTDPDARLYRTGDRARLCPDGNLEFLGRNDKQVKIRGYRVELSEIENVISRLPRVRQCVVEIMRDGPRDLSAFLVLDENAPDLLESVRAAAGAQLPSYMVPSHWVLLDQLPLTPNGKVDRAALPRPAAETRGVASPPENELERQLLEVFRQIFQTEEIGCEDDFFELGGDSLQAIRFVAEAERLTKREVGISRLFRFPMIRALVRDLEQEIDVPRWSSLVPLNPNGSGRPLYVVHGVRGELFALTDFARNLNASCPIYGLQAVEHSGALDRFETFDSMAAHYASEILSHQPTGPYYLFGYSLGGIIAFEVASQLRKAGADIGMVFLLDAVPPNLPPGVNLRMLAPYWRHRIGHHARKMSTSSRPVDYFSKRIRAVLHQVGLAQSTAPAADATRSSSRPAGNTASARPRQADYYQIIGRNHVPQPVDLPVTLIQADGNRRNLHSAWRYLSKRDPHHVRLPGNHLDLLSGEPMRILLKVMRERLASLNSA